MTSPFDKHRDALEIHETMMGTARGRMAVALDLVTDSMDAFVDDGEFSARLIPNAVEVPFGNGRGELFVFLFVFGVGAEQ